MDSMASSQKTFDYIITTVQGAIPYILDTTEPFLQKKLKVLLDDFLYKDSFYHKGGNLSLQRFIASPTTPYLAFKSKSSTLNSKRGNFKLNKDYYHEIVKIMNPAGFADYETSHLTVNGLKCIEPASLEDFNKLLQKDKLFVGTNFINKMTLEGKLLIIKDRELTSQNLQDSCHEYVKHMFSINEMNAFTCISKNNYKIFYEYSELLNLQ